MKQVTQFEGSESGGRRILENGEHHKGFKVQHFKDMIRQTKEIVEEYMQK